MVSMVSQHCWFWWFRNIDGFDGFATLMVLMVSQHWWFRWFRNIDGFDGFATWWLWWFRNIDGSNQSIWHFTTPTLMPPTISTYWDPSNPIFILRLLWSGNCFFPRYKNCSFWTYKNLDQSKWPHHTIKTKSWFDLQNHDLTGKYRFRITFLPKT